MIDTCDLQLLFKDDCYSTSRRSRDLFQYCTAPPVHLRPATPSEYTTSSALRCLLQLGACSKLLPLVALKASSLPASQRVYSRCGLVTLCRASSAAAPGQHSPLGLRPAVLSNLAPSCSFPDQPTGRGLGRSRGPHVPVDRRSKYNSGGLITQT